MKTKIICTVSKHSMKYLKDFIHSGISVVRLNFSHGDHQLHKNVIEDIKRIKKQLGNTDLAIALDTKGPEIRLNLEKEILVQENRIFSLSHENLNSDLKIDLQDLSQIKKGMIIRIDDGKLEMEVIDTSNKILCRSKNKHLIKPNKSVNIPGISMNESTPTEKDKKDIQFGLEMGVDMFFISFVNSAKDIQNVRKIINNSKKFTIFAKIESLNGLKNIEEIVQESDGVMIARGDLSVEIGYENLFSAQKKIVQVAKKYNKPVIMATQMLESMCNNLYPLRSEVSDIGNAVLDGCDYVMLSGETANGKFPVESVKVMKNVILDAERFINEKQ